MDKIWFQHPTRTSPYMTNTVTGQGQSQLSDRNAFVYFYRQMLPSLFLYLKEITVILPEAEAKMERKKEEHWGRGGEREREEE